MSKSFKRLSEFFDTFRRFTYNPRSTAEQEFSRLQNAQGWNQPSKAFEKARRQFLQALAAETGSPVHKFFVDGFGEFGYKSDNPPWQEFRRLQRVQGWKPADPIYIKSKRQFEAAFAEESTSKLDYFFQGFRGFDYNPRQPSILELTRLIKKIRYDFYDAFAEEFGSLFGSDDHDILGWRNLCRVLDIKPIPKSVPQCKIALEPIFVNIFDLLHHVRTGARLIFFETERDLSEYTIKERKVYPKEDAKVQGSLRFLLRHIYNPSDPRDVRQRYQWKPSTSAQTWTAGSNTIRAPKIRKK